MKKIIKSTLAAALLTVAGYGAYTSNESNQMSELALANIEALADEEIGHGIWIVTVYSPSSWNCKPNGGASCPGTPW